MPQQTQNRIIAGDVAVLARRYAGALYELAEERKQLDTVATDLRTLKGLYEASPEFRAVASHPRLTRAQLADAAQKIAVAAKLNGLTANFLVLVAKNRRLGQLDAIIDAFLSQLAVRRGECTANVRAAAPLSVPQQEQLAVKLREIAGGKIHMVMEHDAGLLGGVVVRIGSRLIDASVRTQLARMERQLKGVA